MHSLPNFLTHGAPLRARELPYKELNKWTDAIQNDNKKRFAIYLKTENG